MTSDPSANTKSDRRPARWYQLSRRAKLSLAGAVAVMIGGPLTAGVAWASIPAPNGVIHGCYRTKTGALSVINSAKVAGCPTGSKGLNWNQKGARGATGPAGTARDAGTVVSVGQGGPFFYSEGLTGWRSVTSPEPGEYCLVPDASSTQANTSLLLSLGSPGAGGPGFVTWGGYCGTGGKLALTVWTYNSSGSLASDIPFEAVIP